MNEQEASGISCQFPHFHQSDSHSNVTGFVKGSLCTLGNLEPDQVPGYPTAYRLSPWPLNLCSNSMGILWEWETQSSK